MTFSTTLTIDADYGDDGWEIVYRFGPGDMIVAYTDLSDRALSARVDAAVAEALIAERERNAAWSPERPTETADFPPTDEHAGEFPIEGEHDG